MSDPHEPDESIREELVAYLDGELSPEEARAVEERLSRDERYRREMQGFDRAWNALEELPRASVDDSFTKTTIEMVAVAAEKDLAVQTQAMPTVRRRRTLWIAGLAAVAATLGFALARIVLDHPDRVLLANLPLVQHLDAYNQNLSPEFLMALQKQAGDILEPYRDEELEHQLKALQETEAASTAERRALVEAMSDGEKAALQANIIRFREQLLPEKRELLVALQKELRDGKNSDELQRNMLAYWAWLQDRRDAGPVQADLRKTESIEDRLAMMHKIDGEQNRRIPLSLEEAKKLRAVVKEFATDREFQDVTRQLWERFGRRGGRDRDERSRNWNVIAIMGALQRAARQPEEHEEASDDPALNELRESMRDLWKRIHADMLAALSANTQMKVDRAERPHSELLGLAWRATQESSRPSEEDLEKFFVSGAIDAKRMQELLGMPRERMLEQLRIDYRRELIGDDGSWFGPGRWSWGDRDGRRDGRRRGEGRPSDDRDRGLNGRERNPGGAPRGEGPPRDGPPPPPRNQPPPRPPA